MYILYNRFRIMRNILSAIIIDKDYENHNYEEVKMKNVPNWYESNFDIKLLKNCSNILYEMEKFKGFDCVITIGDDLDVSELNKLPYEIRKKWIHFSEFDAEAVTNGIINVFIGNINRKNEKTKLFSIFTSTYNTSEGMIKRLYNSLLSQTYKNWNWWVIDDSDNNMVIKYLHNLNDPRIFVFQNISNHGCIGFNKHMIAMMCDGDYLVEVDHDDELTEDCLEKLYECFSLSNADFVYSDALEYIDGGSINYGDTFSYGQGYYRREVVKGREYVLPITTSSINCKSIRGIHAMPNHVRCWEKNFYHKIGGHNKELCVIDDMDLISRTFLYGRMAKVNKVLYIQHEGNSNGRGRGDTTTLRRIKEIQRINEFLYHKYDKQIHDRIKELGYEDLIWDEEARRSNLHKEIPIEDLPSMDVLMIE